MKMFVMLVAVLCLMSSTAEAARVSITGTIKNVQIQASEQIPGVNNPNAGFNFETNPRPPLVAGVVFARFSITEATVPDEDVRNAIISSVLLAWSTGKTVSVQYDDAGALIDNRMFGVYVVTVN